MIEMHDLTRRFDGMVAVDRLTLEVHQGEIFGLVGPDGAGKTTTLRLLCGVMHATAGQARVAGEDVAANTDAVKDRIGYMAQRFGLYGDLTVDENMTFYGDLFGVSSEERAELTTKLLEMTRMDRFRDRHAAKLSGGMKQKLALMCTLLHKPKVLFLDEPTNGVDPVSRRDFWAILYELAKDGMTVFVTTAYLDEAERCNRVGLMNHGQLIRCDTPERLRNDMDEVCYEVVGENLREVRERLRNADGVVSVEPSGATLHLFTDPQADIEPLRRIIGPAELRRIVPSLEDVFIALVRKAEKQ
jgi:ABC-2 type transport system ATP-binding protein